MGLRYNSLSTPGIELHRDQCRIRSRDGNHASDVRICGEARLALLKRETCRRIKAKVRHFLTEIEDWLFVDCFQELLDRAINVRLVVEHRVGIESTGDRSPQRVVSLLVWDGD